MKNNNISKEIDLLSIDIDGDDYYIFESLETIRPRVIICEFNPTIPAHIDIYPKMGNYFGCSVAALNRIANTKGFKLVSILGVNCFLSEMKILKNLQKLKLICNIYEMINH